MESLAGTKNHCIGLNQKLTKTMGNLEQKLLEKELELIAEDNDFLMSLFASLQAEHLLTNRDDEKARLIFNHFQYFFVQTKHLKKGLEVYSGQTHNNGKIKYEAFRDEINGLIEKFDVFKNNFRSFVGTLSIHNPIFTYYL
jgi:hypothetical protein